MTLIRRNGSTYYYEPSRSGGKATNRYRLGGRGDAAEMARGLQELADRRREIARLEREKDDLIRDHYRGRDADLGEIVGDAIGGARRFLEALGFKRHARGHWRKRRGHEMDATALETIGRGAAPAAVLGRTMKTPESFKPHNRLAARAGALGIDPRIDGVTDPAELRRRAGDAVEKEIITHARHLAGTEAPTTAVEWELATTAALCWWELRHNEALAWHNRMDKTSPKTMERIDRRTDMLRRRYASLLKTLADVRRLAGPSIRVQQMNVTSGPQQVVNNGAQTQ